MVKYQDHLSDLRIYIEQLYTSKKYHYIRRELSVKLYFLYTNKLLDISQYIQLEILCFNLVNNPSEENYDKCIDYINKLLGVLSYVTEYSVDVNSLFM